MISFGNLYFTATIQMSYYSWPKKIRPDIIHLRYWLIMYRLVQDGL